MTASVLRHAGMTLVHNRAGANMAGGVASSLLHAARAGGGIEGQFGLFELDEFWLDNDQACGRDRVTIGVAVAGETEHARGLF